MNHNSTIIDSRNGADKEKRGSFIYLIFAVICSVVLWFYVAGVDTDMAEKKFTGVSITLENAQRMQERYGFSVLSGYNLTADITVSGKKSDINRLKASDVAVWADLSAVNAAGENKLTVQTDLPDGMTVTACYPQSITVYADETTTKAVAVDVRVVSMTKGGDIEIGDPVLDRKTVNVSGPSNLLERIEKATVSLDLGNVTSSFDITGSVVLTDGQGAKVESPYLRSDATEVTVSYSVYKTKQVPVGVEFIHGYLAGDDVSVKITPSALKVKGEPELIDSLSTLMIRQFDERTLVAQSTDVMLAADSLILPEGVSLDDVAVLENGLQVNLRLLNSSREVPIPLAETNLNVQVMNLPAGINYSFTQDLLAVKLKGNAQALAQIAPEHIVLKLDLAGYTSAGIKANVPVTVEFASSRDAYVVGEYTLSVTLSAAAEGSGGQGKQI